MRNMIAVVGPPGSGRAALVREMCDQTRDWHPDGVVWLTLGTDTTGLAFVVAVSAAVEQVTGRRLQLVDREQAVAALQDAWLSSRRLLVIDELWRASDLALLMEPYWGEDLLIITRTEAVLPPGAEIIRTLRVPATDLRRIARQVWTAGVAAALLDLSQVDDPQALRLSRQLRWDAQLYEDIDPPDALAAILASRLDEPDGAFTKSLRGPRLVNRGPQPDRHDGLLHRLPLTKPIDRYETPPQLLTAVPDRSLVVTCRGNGYDVMSWDPITDEFVTSRCTRQVFALVPGPRSTWFAAISRGTPVVWDRLTGKVLYRFKHGSPTTACELAIAPDGTWLAVGHAGGEIDIWDTATGQRRHVLGTSCARIRVLVISADGSWLAGGTDHGVRVWDPHTGDQVAAVTDGGGNHLVSARKGDWFATDLADGSVLLWDRATAGVWRLRTEATEVGALYVAPDDSWLAAGGEDGHLYIWDVATGALRHTLKVGTHSVRKIAGPDNDSWIAVMTDGSEMVSIWDAVTGTLRNVLPQAGCPSALAVSPDGDWLAALTTDGLLNIWNPSIPAAASARTMPEAAGSAGGWLVETATRYSKSGTVGDIRVRDAETGNAVAAMRVAGAVNESRWDGSVLYVEGGSGVYAFEFVSE